MSPYDIFSPSAAIDATRFTGEAGAKTLVQAAQQFPGGPVVLVFALFWAPVGPGIPAGVLLARHIPLNPAVTFGLYTLSDILATMICQPVFVLLRRHGRNVKAVQWIGRKVMAFAMLGVRAPARGDRLAPTLSRIATIGFGVDIYTAGLVATGLDIPRIPGWASAIVGDLIWFALLLGTSIAAATVADDDRVVGVAVLAAMILIPRLARRFVPALRDEPVPPARDGDR